jgi:hypothetical protein
MGVVAPVLWPGRDQVLGLQVPAYVTEFLIGQPEVLQQPVAADMGHPASLGRFENRVHDAQTVRAAPGAVAHRARLPTVKPVATVASKRRVPEHYCPTAPRLGWQLRVAQRRGPGARSGAARARHVLPKMTVPCLNTSRPPRAHRPCGLADQAPAAHPARCSLSGPRQHTHTGLPALQGPQVTGDRA